MRRLRTKPRAPVACFLSVLLAVPTCVVRASTTWPSTGSAQPSAQPPARGYAVKVYFSKHPQSDQNATAVFAVRRISPTLGVAAFALGQLVVGPTRTETKAGYYSALAGLLHGQSDCGGPAVRIMLNRRGTTVELGTATVRFCRRSMSGGLFDDVRVQSEISRTLTQFPSIKRVVILNKFGQCFGDLSGRNTCLRPRAP